MEPAQITEHHEWLRVGAIEKANSIVELASPFPHRSILEVGSGTGAVLEELAARGFGTDYHAVEPSTALAAFLSRSTIPNLSVDRATLEESRFRDRDLPFDIGILSHVLEHVTEPAALLLQLRRMCRIVIAEVPLEGTLASEARWRVRRAMRSGARVNNSAGHINFFSPGDLDALAHWCGGQVVGRRLYVPRPQLRRQLETGSLGKRLRCRVELTGSRLLGDRIWSRAYMGFYAVAVAGRDPIPEADQTAWPALYFPPA